jgi:hypothetical protein
LVVRPACGLSFERDEADDYWLGAYLLNFLVTEVVFALLHAAVVVATWPATPWRLIMAAAAVQMILTRTAFYPFAKALWLLIASVTAAPPRRTPFALIRAHRRAEPHVAAR